MKGKKFKKEKKRTTLATSVRKVYIPPVIEVILVEIECGIAANSAPVSPGSTNGNTNSVQTDWNGDGNDNTNIETPF
ncbi:hypothetical protein [Elizabethkingia anophelis]|uniref:hypothetical protein n=1 Tax=Elizabethkingia anophelis TaxID=1117645 RepID=UPI00301BFD31